MKKSIFSDTMVEMNWNEIEEKGRMGLPVLFPLGVIEEHGPHLPLGTDIYTSYASCIKIKEKAKKLGIDCLIAPPYYWGINHCTGAFSGSFSIRPDTMKMVLYDIFSNLNQFGFKRIYCMNQHGDPIHNKTILEAIQKANDELAMHIKIIMEPYDLSNYSLSGKEDYCMVDEAKYPPELFEGMNEKLDIHAGAYETATMVKFYPDLVEEDTAKQLPDYSLSCENLTKWLEGGQGAKKIVPLGYAGDPASYPLYIDKMEMIFDIMCNYIASQIVVDMGL